MNPLHYLKLEWQKFGPNGTFRILAFLYTVVFALALILAFLIGHNLTFNNNGEEIRPAADLFTFPRSWNLVAYVGGWINMILLGFMGVFMTTLELGNRTLRQNIISGLNRKELFMTKACAMAGISLAATLLFLLYGVIAGFSESGATGLAATFPSPGIVLCYFLQCFGYLLLGTLTGLLIRQTALATLGYLAYIAIEGIGYLLIYLIVVKGMGYSFVSILLDLLPNQVLGSLTPRPVPQMLHQLTEQAASPGFPPWVMQIVALAYIGLFTFFFFRRLRKADF